MPRNTSVQFRVFGVVQQNYGFSLAAVAEYSFDDPKAAARDAAEKYASSYPSKTPDGTILYIQRMGTGSGSPLYPYTVNRGLSIS